MTFSPPLKAMGSVAGVFVTTTSAGSVVTRAEIVRSPARSVADVPQRGPGVTFLDFDGLGFDPQLTVRGFYGGGEAEYGCTRG